ncbi:hypothetical protein RB2654_13915 [Rhodobacterales bacterium HTCC2654]|uniref:Uncharacterized protein n=1 Tax=Maritimibacter alkaliphilus HTCC2654 TaxID=314271 RepID=A3VGI2_9RHOB|nr:hypothetical protein RB2654_13915 [Rhodobacterales bacterium HTCC2654] [Maritimibacter alkaliphilus HTCC2654]
MCRTSSATPRPSRSTTTDRPHSAGRSLA